MILKGEVQILKYKSLRVMTSRLQLAMTSCAKPHHMLNYIDADEHQTRS